MAGIDPRNALDYRALDSLKRDLRSGDAGATRDATRMAAKKFEAEFLNLLMKQMRAALPQEDPLNSDATRAWQSMADQRLTDALSQRGVGLADMIEKQLARGRTSSPLAGAERPAVQGADAASGAGLPSGDALALPAVRSLSSPVAAARFKPLDLSGVRPSSGELAKAAPGGAQGATPAARTGQPGIDATSGDSTLRRLVERKGLAEATIGQRVNAGAVRKELGTQRAFVEKVGAEARVAAERTGLPADFMVGQAALESGWGRSEIKAADGTQSFNLFGIKAGRNWTGKTIEVTTTEYIQGVPQKVKAKFRAYDSYAEGFADYAKLIQNSPRYAAVREAGSAREFAQALQKGGYATDPLYAQKLASTIQSAQRIGRTLA